ncbi:sulfate adenylyltransferase subunit 1 [Pseudorhodoferax sp.]|uniref:sulfate adenylyltransferase subunit 1 n=1 Tax=Pseudorhodoferax sp. TaxID=1993553 RepID=UPI0039E4BBD3
MTATLEQTAAPAANDAAPTAALRFITCGSVDDGKSTLIGRLLVDSKAVLSDQLAGVQRQGQDGRETDLALLTDGLSAEREQGITIDVAYRYFSSDRRKFIIGDTPGHEQYTRNMVTAASSADAAVLLVDATKLQWQEPGFPLLAQTRRHALLVQLLRVPAVVFAVNKLDAVADPQLAYTRIEAALRAFAQEAGIAVEAVVPLSALKGWNVVDPAPDAQWCGYRGPTLLHLLEGLPNTPAETGLPFAFPVQWVEKFSSSSDTSQGRRVFWGRVATGQARAGQRVRVLPSGQTAVIARVLNHVRSEREVPASHSAGIVLDREVDVSRGDWLLAENDDGSALQPARELSATVAWMDDEPLVPGRAYWALHGHRWVKAKVRRIVHQIDIQTLEEHDATQLPANAIGEVELVLQDAIATLPYRQSRTLGALVLVDQASHKTAAAVLVR